MNLTYGTVCSGIEAPSSAVDPLGWRPLWFSEIEPFPKAVLAHHYPHVPDLGDMTTIPARIRSREVPAPDVFIGGTPCQSFSVAGLRKGLADPRGQLTRTFVEILDALDDVRAQDGKPPALALWENVPGVLSDKDNAFGNFLAALVGEDEPLQPAGPRWTDAGCVLGPTRTAAWRILDAQYFGVAQRRRRVFVVVGARTCGVDPVEVLLVEEGLRRDPPTRGEAREGAADDPAPRAGGGGGGRGAGGAVAHVDVMPTMVSGGSTEGSHSQLSGQLREQHIVPHVLNTTASYPELPDVVGTLSDGAHNGGGSTVRTPTLAASSPSHYPELPEVAWCLQHRDAKGADSDTKPGHVIPVQAVGGFFEALTFAKTHKPMPDTDAEGWSPQDHSPTITYWPRDRSDTGTDVAVVQPPMSVRRLTATECEALQGFPRNWTLIPWKNKPAADCPDGPRYRALGNSMAVPVIRWIAKKIERAMP